MKGQDRVQIHVKEVYPKKHLIIGNPLKEKEKNLIVKGTFKEIYPGDKLTLFGMYHRNKLVGTYFETDFYREIFDSFWMAKWLKMKKNLSNRTIANLIVDKKGIETIWDDFEKLKKAHQIFSYLITKNVEEKTIAHMEQYFKWNWHRLIDDPYELLHHAAISYDMVQTIIQKFHCANPVSSRAKYFIENMLLKAHNSGHFYLPEKMVKETLKEKGIDFKKVIFDGKFVKKQEKIYLESFFSIEKKVAENILSRLKTEENGKGEECVEKWQKETGFTLAKNQKEAVLMALSERFSIVTGGPGVGKTTVCKCITDLLGKDHSILMAAPTGRAAKRAFESTGLPASTVHRLLEFNGTNFKRNQENLILTDVLVIDESSMIDSNLLLSLLEALPLETKIIFVGDVDQLPSVGPGQILKDMIESKKIPVTRLTEIFRQAADSPIITLAYAVNSGMIPEIQSHDDLMYEEYDEEEKVFEKTIEIAEALYKKENPFDVQLLVPMYRGAVGIDAINTELQKRLNPHAKSVHIAHYEIRENDKVIQTKNDYQRGIYNGDVGMVTSATKQKIKVRFQGSEKETEYLPENFKELQLSYAITVHRSQGSEYKFAIIPTVESYGVMLQKNLLYTAITRAKKKLWMIYQKEAFEQSVKPESMPERYTFLKELIKKTA